MRNNTNFLATIRKFIENSSDQLILTSACQILELIRTQAKDINYSANFFLDIDRS